MHGGASPLRHQAPRANVLARIVGRYSNAIKTEVRREVRITVRRVIGFTSSMLYKCGTGTEYTMI